MFVSTTFLNSRNEILFLIVLYDIYMIHIKFHVISTTLNGDIASISFKAETHFNCFRIQGPVQKTHEANIDDNAAISE